MSPLTTLSPLPLSERISLNGTLGSLLVGNIVAAVLFGITSVQFYIYCGRCQRDSKLMRRAVMSCWVLDTLELTLVSHGMYHYTVTNFMQPQKLLNVPWSFAASMLVSAINNLIVSLILIYRLWMFSRSVWLVAVTLPLASASLMGAFGVGITFLIHRHLGDPNVSGRYVWVWYLTFGAQAMCDCVISASLCIILIRQRTGFRRTDSVINTLILYSINACILTSTTGVATVITHVIAQQIFAYLALAIAIPQLMLNSLLALLNSRDSLRERSCEPISVHLSKLNMGPESSSGTSSKVNVDPVVDTGAGHSADKPVAVPPTV